MTVDRTYDRDGFRRIRPGERHPGMVELRLPNGRCFQAVGYGAAADAAVSQRAKADS